MKLLSDASAILAIILNEPNKELVISLTKGVFVFVPEVIKFEVGNALSKLLKRNILTENQIIAAYTDFLHLDFQSLPVKIEQSLKISAMYKIYAYDAYYLEIAKRLAMPLITFDSKMIETANIMGVKVLNRDEGGI